MKYAEKAISFACQQEKLVGILAEPEDAATPITGVIVIVGGPQYRAGSHRQFVLLSRALAAAGYPVLRFDYRGMGDSTGALRDFNDVSLDVAAAIDAMQSEIPGVQQVVLWGLCDGASAALLYCQATGDQRVRGLCLLNPWVRSAGSLARTQVKHYYTQRLRQKEFWAKLLSGQVARSSLSGLLLSVQAAFSKTAEGPRPALPSFQLRMASAWGALDAPILLLLSGNDYTAKEFLEFTAIDASWVGLLERPSVMRRDLPDADHTFSEGTMRARVERITAEWLAIHDVRQDRGIFSLTTTVSASA